MSGRLVTSDILLSTDLDTIPLRSRGKVRDIYEVDDDKLLIVTSDRISAFDVVLPSGIPDKGKVLNQLSLYWFSRTTHIVPNHVITGDVSKYPSQLAAYRDQLHLRSMLVRKLKPIPFECVVRGYLYGSGWKEYQAQGSVSGIALPDGMELAEKFPEPLFTPATKAETGHDVNVSESEMAQALGAETTQRLKNFSAELYRFGRAEAESKGIIIADTKFEFGIDAGGELTLMDEVLTPDSSRFWPADAYQSGRDQPSYDKQFVRDYLETLDWDKSEPGPALGPKVIAGTAQRYRQAYLTLSGSLELA